MKRSRVALPLIALMHWGDRHLSPKPPRVVRRRSDGSPVRAVFVAGDEALLDPAEVEVVPGPGLADPAQTPAVLT